MCGWMLIPSGLMAQDGVGDTLFVDGTVVGYDVQLSGQMPPALSAMMTKCRKAPTQLREKAARKAKLRSAKAASWPVAEKAAEETRIGPLLKTVRSQRTPFNQYCPQWTYADGRVSSNNCLTGCVATALEQIMTYYAYPEALKDTLHGWTTDNYTIEDMLPGTAFKWDKIRNDYRGGYSEEEADAAATISLACGMAVHMNYGLESSGASYWNGEDYLRNAFGYGTVKLYDRVLYTPERWNAMLRSELEAGHPIAYAGHNMSMGGHAFNIDGIDEKGFYHCNWGYNGDYDGWFDLDLLNPFEPRDPDIDGISEGFFNNQYALFLHPEPDMGPDDSDSLDINNLGIVCDSIRFIREPDCQEYTPVDFYFHNEGEATVTYTYEVMTWLPTDTAIFYQADYVGLAAVTLAPGEHKVWRTFCRFNESGERIMGLSHDDETIPFQQTVTIAKGTRAVLEWGGTEVVLTWNNEERDVPVTASFTVDVKNNASGGVAGNVVTYCLRKAGLTGVNDDYQRHWKVLTLPAGCSEKLRVTFTGLLPSTDYEMWVRCPWNVVSSIAFTTPASADEVAVSQLKSDTQSGKELWFDLSGRKVNKMAAGKLFIKKGWPGVITK